MTWSLQVILMIFINGAKLYTHQQYDLTWNTDLL